MIIENENYEAQLQSANSAPIRTTFMQLGTPNVHVSHESKQIYRINFIDYLEEDTRSTVCAISCLLFI